MDTLTNTVSAACIIAVGLAFAEHLINMERFGRQMRWITALLLFICILRPWNEGIQFRSDQWLPQTEENAYADDLQETADALLKESIIAQLKQSLNAALDDHGVNAQVVTIDVHIAEDGSIDIKGITVSGNLLTATIYLREWMGDDTKISALETEDSE